MENGKQPINRVLKHEAYEFKGLTKREYFAGLAMQGILASFGNIPMTEDSMKGVSELAVKASEELLDQLEI